MFGVRKWDEWPCTHACTAFFRIAKSEVAPFVPPPLVVAEDADGLAEIEVGYVRFREGIHSLPATEELAWAIGVERVKGFGPFAFYAMNIAADNSPFLDFNAGVGFTVHRPPVRFTTDLDKRSFRVEDERGVICTIRHQPEGSVTLPVLPSTTEVWTGKEGSLRRRLFKWKGIAKVHLASSVATTLHDHPYFGGVRVSRANPVPEMILGSQRVATASQLFSQPAAYF